MAQATVAESMTKKMGGLDEVGLGKGRAVRIYRKGKGVW